MRHYADAEDANLIGFDAANYRWQDLESLKAGGGARDQADVFRETVVDRFDARADRLFRTGDDVIDDFAQVQGDADTPYWSDQRRVDTLVRYFETAREPWFVHTHLLDTHCCNYTPDALLFPEEPDQARRAYESQLHETDGQVQRLISALMNGGLLDRTIVVIYSDHMPRWHTKGRVPLIMHFPGGTNRGRVAANVQLADVAPTMLDWIGVDAPSWMDGASLLDDTVRNTDRPIFGVSRIDDHPAVTSYFTALSNASPPNYGAMSVTMVLGKRWFEMSLVDGTVTSGEIAGHTNAAAHEVDDDTARALMLAKLQAAGFEVGVHP
jgi:hypothetical protein